MDFGWRGLDVTRFVACRHVDREPTQGDVTQTLDKLVGRLDGDELHKLTTTHCCYRSKRDFDAIVYPGLSLGVCDPCYAAQRITLYRTLVAHVRKLMSELNAVFQARDPEGGFDVEVFVPASKCAGCARVLCDQGWGGRGPKTLCGVCERRFIKKTGIISDTVPLLARDMRRLFRTLLLVEQRLELLPTELWVQIGLYCL